MQATVDNQIETPGVAPKSLTTRLLLLGLLMLVVAAVVLAISVGLFQANLQTGLIALAACFISALGAHVCGEYPKGDVYIMARMALQMVVRTALPFVVSIWGLYFAEPPLEKSLVFYMILFYLVGLVADVQMSLARLKAETQSVG